MAVNGNGSLEGHAPTKLEKCPISENDYSIALIVRYGAFETFLGGDLGGSTVDRYFGPKCMSYHDMETVIAPKVGNVEILKANHHGSAHSSNPLFINTLRPEVTIVSSGGYYHHPGREVVERLSPWGPILVTHAVSLKEWPEGVPMGTNILGDIRVDVVKGGGSYFINGEEYKSFDDDAEARGDDHPGPPEAHAGVNAVGSPAKTPHPPIDCALPGPPGARTRCSATTPTPCDMPLLPPPGCRRRRRSTASSLER